MARRHRDPNVIVKKFQISRVDIAFRFDAQSEKIRPTTFTSKPIELYHPSQSIIKFADSEYPTTNEREREN
jgi:hypothetical protein